MRRRFLVLLLAGFLVVVGVFWYSGPEAVVRDVLRFDVRFLLVLFFFQVLIMVLWAVKWRVVLRHSDVSFWNVLLVSFAGYFVNNLTQVNMAGGEPVMAYLLPKVDEGVNTERSAASVIVNTFLTVFPVFGFILLAVFLALSYDLPWVFSLVLLAGGFVVALVFCILVLLFVREDYSRRLVLFSIRVLRRSPVGFMREHALDAEHRIDSIIANFNDAVRKTTADRSILLAGVFISTVIWCIYIFQTYVIFNAIGFTVPLHAVVVVKVVTVVAGFLSITPGAVGFFEGVSAWLFSLYGIPLPTATAAVFIERFFTYWVGNLIGFLSLAYLGASYLLDRVT
jgi:hypothetical protein